MSVIDTATREVIKTIVVGKGPFFLAANPDGQKLYVSNAKDTTVTVVAIPSLTVLQTIQDVGDQGPGKYDYGPFDLDFGPTSSTREVAKEPAF
jgi:YVTN family beta-propeller protein